jgi:predicted Zn-dependent protease
MNRKMRKPLMYESSYLYRPGLTLISLLLVSCSVAARIPTVSDDRVEHLIKNEAAQIIAITTDSENFARYRFYLSDFPRKDILGLSVGNRRIYISYSLAQLAMSSPRHWWLLRQTLAHEIAHELSGHANQTETTAFNRQTLSSGMTGADIGLPPNIQLRPYSLENELAADLEGIHYWQKLGWDCHIWVRILQGFQRQNYTGDVLHPTDQRLKQAVSACPSESNG